MLALYSVAVFASAFLLFWVEPLFAKKLLPLLGGSSSVWNTCLMYFQGMLLAGYLYAHFSVRWLGCRRQALLHLLLVGLALATLPVAVPDGWSPPAGGAPVPWLLLTLTAGLGAPFFLLAATSPLLQRWVADTGSELGRDPYVLYATSNLGSLTALLGFPFLLEPRVGLAAQTRAWGWGFGAFALLTVGCALLLWGGGRPGDDGSREGRAGPESAAPDGGDGGTAPGGGVPGEVSLRRRVLWVALAFVPSSLLLGVTDYLTTDVAAVPLFWVVPLALYLLTFVAAFSRRRLLPRVWVSLAHAGLAVALTLFLFWGLRADTGGLFFLHLLGFFVTALFLHDRLARSRPHPAHLTEFYIWIAVGGALGGAFNAVAAPILFDTVLEYRWMVVAACFLRPSAVGWGRRWLERVASGSWSVLPGLLMGAGVVAGLVGLGPDSRTFWTGAAVAAAVAVSRHRSASQTGVAVASLAVAGALLTAPDADVLFRERSFFGAHRVERERPGPRHVLYHGTTIHGAQVRDGERERIMITYYHPRGPAGEAFRAFADRWERPRRVAVVGLGTGSLLCYGRPTETWTFYEVDPIVERIARDRRWFTYLDTCPAEERVVLGDARLTLRGEPDGTYDVLVLDAFSSDAIPVHLLTAEAFRLYRRVLAEDGVLLLHISNRHLRLEAVVSAVAEAAGLEGRVASGPPDPSGVGGEGALVFTSTWVALVREGGGLPGLSGPGGWRPLSTSDRRPWTDDFSNLLGVMDW